MNHHPVEHTGSRAETDRSRATPLPPDLDGPDDSWRPSEVGIPFRPDTLSTKAVLASLAIMGGMGAAGFFLMHSIVIGDDRRTQSPVVAVVQAAAPASTLTPALPITNSPSPLPPPPAPPAAPWEALPSAASTATPSPAPTALPSDAWTATPSPAPSAVPAPAWTATARPTDKAVSKPAWIAPSTVSAASTAPETRVVPHVHVYPFPVFGAGLSPSAQSATAAQPPPQDTASTNPYDEAPATTAAAAVHEAVQPSGAPSQKAAANGE
jgi:hypothetical protein